MVMYPMELKSRRECRIGGCFSSGQFCGKEKDMKAKAQDKEFSSRQSDCLLFGGTKMTRFLKSQFAWEFS